MVTSFVFMFEMSLSVDPERFRDRYASNFKVAVPKLVTNYVREGFHPVVVGKAHVAGRRQHSIYKG